jgi:hypothetical protein
MNVTSVGRNTAAGGRPSGVGVGVVAGADDDAAVGGADEVVVWLGLEAGDGGLELVQPASASAVAATVIAVFMRR